MDGSEGDECSADRKMNISSEEGLESFLLLLVSQAEEARESLPLNGNYSISSTSRKRHPWEEGQLSTL